MLNKPIRIVKLSKIPSLIGEWPRFFVHAEGVGKSSGLAGAEDWLRVWSVVRFASQADMQLDRGDRVAIFPNKQAAVDVGQVMTGRPKSDWAHLEAKPGPAFGQWLESWAIFGRQKAAEADIKGAWIGVALCPKVADTLNQPELSN